MAAGQPRPSRLRQGYVKVPECYFNPFNLECKADVDSLTFRRELPGRSAVITCPPDTSEGIPDPEGEEPKICLLPKVEEPVSHPVAIVNSIDPNDKVGSHGADEQQYLGVTTTAIFNLVRERRRCDSTRTSGCH